MSERWYWSALTAPGWLRWATVVLCGLLLCLLLWMLAGRAHLQHQAEVESRYLQTVLTWQEQLHQLALLPSAQLLQQRQRVLHQQRETLRATPFSLTQLLEASQARLQLWQPGTASHAMQLRLAWTQVAPLLRALRQQLPAAEIRRLVIQPHQQGELMAELVLEVSDEEGTVTPVVQPTGAGA